MKIKTLFLMVAGAILVPSALYAQPNVPIQQFEHTQRETQLQNPKMLDLSTNTEAPEFYPGENADVGPQHILRNGPPRRTWFEVVADSQYYFSDNAFLSDTHKVSAPLFVNTIQAAFAPQAFAWGPGLFAPQVGFRSQWFNYGLGGGPNGINQLDFNAQTAFASGQYKLGNWVIFSEFDFTRLVNQPDYIEAYREYVPSVGVQRLFPVNDNLAFSIGGQVDYHWTETPTTLTVTQKDTNDRFDASLSLAMSWQIIPRLVLAPFYHIEYTQYQHFTDDSAAKSPTDRTDFINTMGTTLTYYFTKNITARVFASYEIKQTDYSQAFNYHKFDAGGGLGLDIKF